MLTNHTLLALRNAASIAEMLHDMPNYGFTGSATLSWPFLKSRRDAYVKRLNGIYDGNLKNSAVEKIEGTARLGGKGEVVVETGDGERVIQVGARPPICGLCPIFELCACVPTK